MIFLIRDPKKRTFQSTGLITYIHPIHPQDISQ